MATSNPEYVAAVLEALGSEELEFSLLHGADRVRDLTVTSDIDLVVDVDPRKIMIQIDSALQRAGLVPILDWPYDVGATRTAFLSTPDAADGVQVDFLCDPKGLGRYGIRSGNVLSRSVVSEGVRVLRPVDELAYLVRKRYVKGDVDRLSDLVQAASLHAATDLRDSIDAVLSPLVAVQVRRILSGRRPLAVPRPMHAVAGAARLVRRVLEPIGFLAHLPTDRVAADLAARFGRFIPHVEMIRFPQSTPTATRVKIESVRRRPGLVLASGPVPRGMRPDLILAQEDPALAAGSIVESMRMRTMRRYSDRG